MNPPKASGALRSRKPIQQPPRGPLQNPTTRGDGFDTCEALGRDPTQPSLACEPRARPVVDLVRQCLACGMGGVWGRRRPKPQRLFCVLQMPVVLGMRFCGGSSVDLLRGREGGGASIVGGSLFSEGGDLLGFETYLRFD